MGTTQRILPGVPGQPNWGDLNKSVTRIAKTIEKEKNSEGTNENTPEQESKDYKKLIERRNYHIKSAFKNLVRTGGGSKLISNGGSKSIGKAGIKSASRLVGFFSGVSSNGLQQTLTTLGFSNLIGKTFQEVVDFLLLYCSESNIGMDETAANSASCEVLNELAEQTGNDFEKFEELIKEYVQGNGLSDILCKFWGLYIFEHLSQRFEEKIAQQRGESVSTETFKVIKDDIMGQVKVLNESRPLERIDWQGAEGIKTIELIFESIINILGNEGSN